ncbi:MAG: membrane protein insertion efficiency factor YidD [SAR324 cluster bacterium]|uniref:Putative membrane protein insertion efficiency factor n=1 Tax=SAR324 cluster bacterium TaxID=2024889 RepID=A0A2A4T636_9DELT|nr:MAG: membrane protein insertion efficiency factor YidD [SAR324 cluster bacterium]
MSPQQVLNKILSAPFMLILWLYQKGISPFLPSSCIYWPSCSEYSKQAFRKHGPFWGIYLTLTRLIRCQPFCQGGVDKVPETPSFFSRHHHG